MTAALLLALGFAVYPPEGSCDVTESPKHTFRIETYGVQPHANWIVPRDKKASKVVLPDPHNKSENYPYEFSVSPDEQWIVLKQKQYHRANAAWLYERTTPLHYAEVKPSAFSGQAWRFLNEHEHRKFIINDDDYRRIIVIGDFPKVGSQVRKIDLGNSQKTIVPTANDQAILICLYGDDFKTDVDSWFCYYDLQKHCFYVDAALRKHNKGRVTPSHNK